MNRNGFGLIELMVVVALIGILALVSTPLTSGWVNSARLNEARGAFDQAVGQAKAVALRNPSAIRGAAAASAICLSDDGVLSVKAATPAAGVTPAAAATCAAGGAAPLWSTRLPANVRVQLDAQAWSCSCLTNKGLLTTAGANCAACGANLNLKILSGTGSGEEYDNLTFY